MPVVTSDLVSGATTVFRALWETQFLAASQQDMLRDKLATLMPSNTLIEDYEWMGTVPKMREWLGERQLSGLSRAGFQIKNRDWEDTIEVSLNTLADDRLGIVKPRITQLAQEAVRFQDEHLVNTLIAGNTATGLCYDGQQFFDTDHVTPGATYQTQQSNLLTGTLTGLGTDLELQTDFDAAMTAMRNFKDEEGRPMNIKPTHVLCPASLESRFKRLLNTEYYPGTAGVAGGGTANVWKGAAELIVNGLLTDVDDWYLLALDQPVKPFIFQMRQEPQFTALDRLTDPEVFMKKRLMYGVDGRWAAGYAFWQLAILSHNT